MSTTQAISSKLERLRTDCQRLETYRQLSLDAFLEDPAVQGDTSYLLITAFRGALTIGTELLRIVGLPKPEEESGVFALLAREEVLSEVCVSQLTAMQGLCLSLAQQYEAIDPRWVYQTLQINLAGLDQFVEQAQAFLDHQLGGGI